MDKILEWQTVDTSGMDDSGWIISAKRFVAFIDIMGFKSMVNSRDQKYIHNLMKKVVGATKQYENAQYKLSADEATSAIRCSIYSDSIMLYSFNDIAFCLNVMSTALAGITEALYMEGIPFKGGLAHGEMTVDFANSIFFGKPLINAHLLQEELSFYGIVIHGSVEPHLAPYQNIFPTVEYLCQFKMGKAHHRVIHPKIRNYAKPYSEWLTQTIDEFRNMTSGHLRAYVENTQNFLNHVSEHYKQVVIDATVDNQPG